MTTVVLVGPMGAGKTSIGRRVARDLGRTFTDTDKVIVREHGPIPAIFENHGEAHFRALERAAVADALAGGGIVALGGGAILDAATRADLADHRVVLLTVAPHIVASRIGGGEDRPLLQGEDAVVRWNRIWAERRPLYEDVADVAFDTSSGPLAAVVAQIVAWVRQAEEAPE